MSLETPHSTEIKIKNKQQHEISYSIEHVYKREKENEESHTEVLSKAHHSQLQLYVKLPMVSSAKTKQKQRK